MLDNSVASSNMDNPIPLEEAAVDLEVMFSIITGRTQEALHRVTEWDHAARLYRLVDKYQLDSSRPWFSQICRAHATEEPWEALFLGCNVFPMDKDLIRTAISEGFEEQRKETLLNRLYFTKRKYTEKGWLCWRTLEPSNVSVELGLKLGYHGLLAYNLTFGGIRNPDSTGPSDSSFPTYTSWGDDFVRHLGAIERAYKIKYVKVASCRVVHDKVLTNRS